MSTWCTATAVMIAFTLAWRVDGAAPLTPETAKLNLFGHVSSFRTEAFDFKDLRFEGASAVLAKISIESDRQRRPATSPTLFVARDVPAGYYGIQPLSGHGPAGRLMVHVGSTPLVLQTIPVSGISESMSASVLRLPSDVRSLTIEGDNAATHAGVAVQLWPLNTPREPSLSSTHRAARYTSGDTFFADEFAYPEPTGFWVAGGRTASVILTVNDDQHGLFVRNAPVDNHVAIDIDGNVQELQLEPREERLVPLPRQRRPFRVRITSQSGFRPSTEEPASTDMRYLGCWIELR
jgi:hypothetical protein